MTIDLSNIRKRRELLKALASSGLLAALYPFIPSRAEGNMVAHRTEQDNSDIYHLTIGKQPLIINGQPTDQAITINGGIPAPLLRLKEGRTAVLNVSNQLNEDTSIHWHGILLPYQMDGVPGISFAGIKPKETFQYSFPVQQSGTYWYHSHSGMQEQLGLYGPLIIDPIEPEPHQYQQDYTVILSDWSFTSPKEIFRNLKISEGYYNYDQRTVSDFF
jgi:FtsP/CotA-like multicopper oxidase with cupredoxin domain